VIDHDYYPDPDMKRQLNLDLRNLYTPPWWPDGT